MKENNELHKNNTILIILAVLIALIIVIGATYAYFTAQRGSGGSAEIDVESGTTDSLTFNNESGNINIVATQDNFGQAHNTITQSASVKATLVPNNTTNTASETYNVFLVIENNDLIYTENNNTPELLLKVTDPDNKEYTQNVDGLKYVTGVTDKNSETYSGYDITMSTNQVYKIVSDYVIDTDQDPVDQTWQVEASLINLNKDQNANTGKTFEGSIYITTDEEVKLNEINSLETTASTTSITATANITSGSSDIAKYYFAIKETTETPEDFKISTIAEALEQDYQMTEAESSYTFSENITENNNYKIYTYAVDKSGYRSNIYETVVTAADGEIPKVENVDTSSDFDSITLNFTKVEGTTYRVRLDNGTWTEFSEEESHTFSNLALGSVHKVYVQAKNTDGKVSNVKTMMVATTPYAYPSVSNIEVTEITATGFKVKATVTQGSETIEKVEFKTDKDDTWYQGEMEEESVYTYTFSNLQELTDYVITVKVTSTGKAGTGQSNSESVQTLSS